MSETSYVVENASCVVTCDGDEGHPLGVVDDGAVWVDAGVIRWVGARPALPDDAPAARLDANGGCVLPGLVDCHTHVLFAGDRADEFALRSAGATYAEIMAAGGGIVSTMKAVRAASEDTLVEATLPRVRAAVSRGVTTLEAKSGYGLDPDSELKSLRAIAQLGPASGIDVVATCLSAHALPPEFKDDRAGFVKMVCDEILPEVAARKLAAYADIFVEAGAFTVDDGRAVLGRAKQLGLAVRVHAEQLSRSGGATLAAEVGALAAGHLEFANADDARALAEANVVCEVLATAQVFLGMEERVPGRMLRDAGCRCAVATDWNPGSANVSDLHLAAGLAVTMAGLSAEEAILGITREGAAALGLDEPGPRGRGRIASGRRADLCILDAPSPWPLVYEWGTNRVTTTVAGGAIVFDRGR